MKAIEHLHADHESILEALDQLDTAVAGLQYDRLSTVMTYLTSFVDGVHQQKEEDVLFPFVVGRLNDMVRGAVEALTKEHFIARAYLRAASRVLEAARAEERGARATLVHSLKSYSALMRSHIKKENDVFLPFVERTLNAEDDAEILDEMVALHEEFSDVEVTKPAISTASFIDARTLSDEPDSSDQPKDQSVPDTNRYIFDEGGHKNIWLHDFGRGLAVQANQFLIVDNGEGMVLDPGGPKVYADVYAETMLRLEGGALKYIFLSHQDPDIGTSLNAWLMDTKATAYVSKLWVRFLPHFGIDRLLEKRLIGVPDSGQTLRLGQSELLLVPAHFLHSPGNFQVYDPRSRVLFSGDLGASIGTHITVVEDFDQHIKSMLGFHRRYVPTGAALRAWVKMVRELDIETIAPQHGAIIRGRPMVRRFLDWCETLECGMDVMEDVFRLPGEGTMVTRVRR